VGGVFAERVAGGEVGNDALFREDAGGGDRDSKDGGLGVLGELEKPRASSASSKTARAAGKLS
jgi:hypothetical protein